MHKPLSGKTVVVTGSSKTTAVLFEIAELGGEAVFFPLIATKELNSPDDKLKLEKTQNFDWLIFTSQNAVEAFCAKLKRHQLNPSDFNGKIAAVGSKTAQLLKENHFEVSFTPTVFSADVFVNEFPRVAGDHPSCLFLRGSKAKDTLRTGLPFKLLEWTVYDTQDNLTSILPFIQLIKSGKQPIIIFASPSAVDMFAKHIAPEVGWGNAVYASIGHITAARLEHYGAQVTYKPTDYTMVAVIEEIRKREEIRHDRT
ncbi:uroporphyrinogen-III synthase [Ureibacillus chungkukjangi]|uniref:Uroporphyrinogen-III synthase n=1 Tax=Ureibacillus chungkukjangi TaxID=1202712 RepID=A0A318TVH8_9BACL|nr:uroporphyrinogen-III synthase [Ureibacillus chungkukjangi]MCM3389684.1 uroporphyrinogen-III synthase [Ureibacillus chungkukjangi]PYF08881.1 uroporphyrinogen-III synthase [Ureibacillus chungkukjangi]